MLNHCKGMALKKLQDIFFLGLEVAQNKFFLRLGKIH